MKKMVLLLGVMVLSFLQFSAVDANQGDNVPDEHTQTYYIHKVNREAGGRMLITAERIEWYEGEEADAKFREIEQDPEMTEAVNGYYIVETGEGSVTFEVADNAAFLMQIYNRTGKIEEADIVWNEAVTGEKFASILESDEAWSLKDYPYHITFRNGKAVRIVQQYLP
ncbi:hypothetical protein [Paenibacillus tarimensis]|uniref:hypothetical protein n=1 Tax=Paenibacillus tarimensis TaxID=416012 RepID=UPI001F247732|nr:hypothetical protein [Paenibacillus tarimensis]MCF2944749.1 hypothetical protein [Paenibacillus tarimensis]